MTSTDSIFAEISALINNIDDNLELTNCDREPIHTPNLIQPHGVLLAVSAAEWQILQVSLNTKQMLGIEPDELLERPLATLLGEEQVAEIERSFAENVDRTNPILLTITSNEEILLFDGIVHRRDGIILVELEPRQSETNQDFYDFYKLVKSPVSRLQNTNTLNELCQAIVEEIKQITEFDRVMVYRFNPEGAGTVIAEAANEGIQPYLGLNYPATDIPKQAKHLFKLTNLRLIPDVAYEPVGITPELNPLTGELLDMSLSILRSVSPFHIEYLDNMGVDATLVVSLVKNKQLWGLISCHNYTPKLIPYEIRTVCEFIGQIASVELSVKEDNQDSDYRIKLKSIQAQFVRAISQTQNLKQALVDNSQPLLDLVSAKGVVLVAGSDVTLLGETPPRDFIVQMLPWLEDRFESDVIYQTNYLEQVYSPASNCMPTASGLLALSISKFQKTSIIWFRPEVVQTVNWAGNPNQTVARDEDGTLLMSPRTSFNLWKETVRGTSLPWKSCELEAALELRNSIVSIVLRKAEEISVVNKELTRSNQELDAFAYIASHDLKEPLRGIYNYSSFLIEDYGEILDEAGINKLNTLMRLTHRMENLINSLLHYSRLGRANLQLRSTDLNSMVADVLDTISASARDTQVEFQIPRPLPVLQCDRTQVNELFTNLISNGIKYNQKPQKIIEIGYLDNDDPIAIEKMSKYAANIIPKTILYVRDNGIGIREKHLQTIFRIFKRLHSQKKYGGGTGAGLTIAQKIVNRHGGEIWVESVYQQGSTFYFTLQ